MRKWYGSLQPASVSSRKKSGSSTWILDRSKMGNTVFRPASISWYLNESKIPNVGCDKDFKFYATADIKADDELTVNYDEYSER
jgi:hypothetical protein